MTGMNRVAQMAWNFHLSTCDYGLGYPCRCGGAERERQVREARRLAWWAREWLRAGDPETADAYLSQLLSLLDFALGAGGIQQMLPMEVR